MEYCQPAFPVYAHEGAVDIGMTLRDYFAGQTLALIAPFFTIDEMFNKPEKMAKTAYKIADAMLAEREKEGKNERSSTDE